MDPMPKPVICTLACILLSCLCAGRDAAAQDGRFFTVPPFVFPAPPKPDFDTDELAGFCFAKTTDNRAYLLVALRNTDRTINATEQALDRLARDLGLEAEKFECPPKAFGYLVFLYLSKSGKELREFVVPDELLGPAPRRSPPLCVEPPPRISPIVEPP
jgi:hypothetical protein